MERVYLKLSHYHTEYTAIRCRLVVLCCDAVLYFLEREALQWKEIKIRKCTVIELFNLQNKDWANPTLWSVRLLWQYCTENCCKWGPYSCGANFNRCVFQASKEEIMSLYTVNGTFSCSNCTEGLQILCKLKVFLMKEQTSALNCVKRFNHPTLEVYQTTPNLLLC